MISKAFIKAQIDSVRKQIGRNVTVYYPVTYEHIASGYYNPITYTPFQPTLVGEEILARVHWVGNEAITATPGGKYYMGEASITVDPSYTALLESAQNDFGYVLVDGQEMSITKINPLGAPEINRVRAVLKSKGNRPDLG